MPLLLQDRFDAVEVVFLLLQVRGQPAVPQQGQARQGQPEQERRQPGEDAQGPAQGFEQQEDPEQRGQGGAGGGRQRGDRKPPTHGLPPTDPGIQTRGGRLRPGQPDANAAWESNVQCTLRPCMSKGVFAYDPSLASSLLPTMVRFMPICTET